MLSLQGLIAVLWLFLSISVLLSAGRFAIRFRYSGQLYNDDYFHAAAVVFCIIFCGLSHVYAPNYYLPPWNSSQPTDWSEIYANRPIAILINVTFWTTIYLVKFGLLSLYRRIFSVSNSFRTVWLIVTGLAIVSYWISFALVIWECRPPRHPWDVGGCDIDWAYYVSAVPGLWVPAALHLATDIAIIALPLWQLQKLRLHGGTVKLGVALLFLVAIIGTVMDVIRAALTGYQPERANDIGEYAVCEVLEPMVAVILSALIAYGPLLRSGDSEYGDEHDAERGGGGAGGHESDSDTSSLGTAPTEEPMGAFNTPRPQTRASSMRSFLHPISYYQQLHQLPGQNQQQQAFGEQMSFIQNASPVERRFYRLRLMFMEQQGGRNAGGGGGGGAAAAAAAATGSGGVNASTGVGGVGRGGDGTEGEGEEGDAGNEGGDSDTKSRMSNSRRKTSRPAPASQRMSTASGPAATMATTTTTTASLRRE